MDIASIVAMAKESILEDGYCIPKIFTEFDDGSIAIAFFAEMADPGIEKKKMFFGAGRKLGQEKVGKKPCDICLVTESWMSFVPLGEKFQYAQPSDDPNRKEALVISRLQMFPGPEKSEIQSSMQTFEMIRHGDTLDLLAGPEMKREVHNHLLMYFLSGILSAEYNDQQLLAKMNKFS